MRGAALHRRLAPGGGNGRAAFSTTPLQRWAQRYRPAKDEKYSRNSLIPALNELSGESEQ